MIKCKFENAKEADADLRHVVTDSIIVKDDKILLIKRAAHLVAGGKYGMPGGYLDRDETVPQGALREALEETGWECKIKQLLGVVDSPQRGDDRQNVGFIFWLEPIKQVAEPDHETDGMEWFPLDKLPPLEQIGFDHGKIIETFIKTTLQGKPFPQFLE